MIEKQQILTSLEDIPQNAAIAIYGCGQGGRAFRRLLRKKRKDLTVLFFLDSFKKGKMDGLKILAPEALEQGDITCDLICIASIAWHEIRSHLQKIGITNYKVVSPNFLESKGKKKRQFSAEVPIQLQEEYYELYNSCHGENYPASLITRFKEFRNGGWRPHFNVIVSSAFSFKDKVVVDFGCKYGQSAPIFLMLGAAKVIGIDVEPGYITNAEKIIRGRYPDRVEFFQSEGTMIPLQPETVDFVYMNEVISHINPQYLDMVFLEVSRILKKGGRLYISDGNNIENPGRVSELLELWERFENGPDGSEINGEKMGTSYRTQRKKLIAERYPELSEDKLDLMSADTSGLFGDTLVKVADLYMRTGELIRRPYRRGICPTHPGKSGVVIEMGFYPLEVEFKLKKCGFRSERITGRSISRRVFIFLRNIYRRGRRDTVSRGFKIVGIKEF